MVFLNKGTRCKLPGITGIFPFAAISVKLTPKVIKKPVTDQLQTCGVIVGIQCHGLKKIARLLRFRSVQAAVLKIVKLLNG